MRGLLARACVELAPLPLLLVHQSVGNSFRSTVWEQEKLIFLFSKEGKAIWMEGMQNYIEPASLLQLQNPAFFSDFLKAQEKFIWGFWGVGVGMGVGINTAAWQMEVGGLCATSKGTLDF